MENPTARINGLMAELEELKRAHFTVGKKITDEERREKGAALAEYKSDWETETAKGRQTLTALSAERDGIEARIKELRQQQGKLNDRISEAQRGVDIASERFKSLRDPILRELQAGTSDLMAEFLKIVDAHIAHAYRILPPAAVDLSKELREDIASRDRRLARLKALREDVERTWWKDTDASEGELRSRLSRALGAIPAAENKSGGLYRDEFLEFAKRGGGLWPAAN